MPLHRIHNAFNDRAGRGFIALTQLATRRGWVRGPSFANDFEGHGAFRYRVVRDFYRADPATHPVENCHEMVFDRTGRLFVLTDHPRNNVLVFGTDGALVNSWTLGMRGAHGLSSANVGGEQHLFVCDAYGGRVVETTLDGQVVREFPSPHELGIYRSHEPYLPTQTAVAPNGDVYVAHGYGSQRVIRFDANGAYLQHFGGRGRGEGTLQNAHGIAIDGRRGPGAETLLVISRERQCLERFSLDGRYLGRIDLPGGYPCRPVLHGACVYVALCWSGAFLRPNSGFVAVLDADDRIVATLGGHLTEGASSPRLASDYSTFKHAHDVAVDAFGNLAVCEWNAGHALPIRLERVA